VIIRPHRDGDDESIYRVARLAFGGPREPEPQVLWSNQKGWHGLVAEDAGAVVGALKVRDYRQFFGGSAVPMGGIASVSVDAHARGQGVATALLDAALPIMRERGQVISALYPTVPPLYRSRGWEQTGSYERAKIRPELFAMLPKASPVVLKRPGPEDLPALHDCYLRFASTVDGMLDRSTESFTLSEVLDLDIVSIAQSPDGEVRGYLTASRLDDDKLLTFDLIAHDEDTGRALLANLGRWTGILTEIALRIVDPAWWQLLMTLPVLHDVTNHPWMLRVVDLPAAVAARGWPFAAYLAPCSVDLEITDEHAPWQAGRHRLIADGGKVVCEPGGTGAVRLAARALGPWFAGSADTAMLRRAGLLTGDPADAHVLDLLTGAPHPARMADSF